MKPEKTNIIGIGYIEKENRYFATFEVLNLNKYEIKGIIKYFKILNPQKNCKIHINNNNLYVTDFFEAEVFESMYKHVVKSAREGVVPERVESEILDKELDICLMEQDIEFSVRAGADSEKYRDLLKVL